MGCMSVFFVLVAVLHVLHIGGIQKSFLVLLRCSMPIDGSLTGNSTLSRSQFTIDLKFNYLLVYDW